MTPAELQHHLQQRRQMLECERQALEAVIDQVMPLVWRSRGRIGVIGRELKSLDRMAKGVAWWPQ